MGARRKLLSFIDSPPRKKFVAVVSKGFSSALLPKQGRNGIVGILLPITTH